MTLTAKQKSMILMVITASMWSIGGIFIKLISWNPLLIAGLRSLISALILGGYMIYMRVPFKLSKATLGAGFGLSVSAILFVTSNKLTTAANAIVLQYSCPIFILIMTALILKRGLKKREVIAVVLTMIGIIIFFFDQLSPGNIVGNILAIFAGIFLAMMFVSMGEGGEDDSVRLSGILLAHCITIIVGTPIGGVLTTSISYREVLFVIILGVFQLGIPYLLYALAAKDCPPLACSLIGMIEPLLNPVWVMIFAGEMPGIFACIGGIIILATVTWWCISDSKAND